MATGLTKFDKPTAEAILTDVVSAFSDEQKSNLLFNLTRGVNVLCGKVAYQFCEENAGCLLTLSLTRELPSDDDPNRDVARAAILALVGPEYSNVINRHGMRYYFATQSLDEASIRQLLLSLLRNE